MSRPTCVMVISLPRSGSSMVAGILHKLGVRMVFNEQWTANEFNPLGYYEDEFFVELHCQAINTHDDDFLAFDPSRPILWPKENLALYHGGIKYREERFSHWGVKDSRTILFVGFFARLCESYIKVIEIVRDRSAVINSLNNVWAKNECAGADQIPVYYDRWTVARSEAIQWLYQFGAQVMRVNYETILENKAAQVANIANFVGLPVVDEAIDFIRPEFNHGGTYK